LPLQDRRALAALLYLQRKLTAGEIADLLRKSRLQSATNCFNAEGAKFLRNRLRLSPSCIVADWCEEFMTLPSQVERHYIDNTTVCTQDGLCIQKTCLIKHKTIVVERMRVRVTTFYSDILVAYCRPSLFCGEKEEQCTDQLHISIAGADIRREMNSHRNLHLAGPAADPIQLSKLRQGRDSKLVVGGHDVRKDVLA
jgi:hypothetical protein